MQLLVKSLAKYHELEVRCSFVSLVHLAIMFWHRGTTRVNDTLSELLFACSLLANVSVVPVGLNNIMG